MTVHSRSLAASIKLNSVRIHPSSRKGSIFSSEAVAFTMATSQAFTAVSMLYRLASPSFGVFQSSSKPVLTHFSNTLQLATTISIPAISLNIPGLLTDIWEGVLRAVPKKKTSHMKRRHRQLAGKALKDVTSLNACPSCGEPKRAHHLCPTCVAGICERFHNNDPADSVLQKYGENGGQKKGRHGRRRQRRQEHTDLATLVLVSHLQAVEV